MLMKTLIFWSRAYLMTLVDVINLMALNEIQAHYSDFVIYCKSLVSHHENMLIFLQQQLLFLDTTNQTLLLIHFQCNTLVTKIEMNSALGHASAL